jgi:hypothetical protein
MNLFLKKLRRHNRSLLQPFDFIHFPQPLLHINRIQPFQLNRIQLIIKIQILPQLFLMRHLQLFLHLLLFLLLDQILPITLILLLYLFIRKQLLLRQQSQLIKIVLNPQLLHFLAYSISNLIATIPKRKVTILN